MALPRAVAKRRRERHEKLRRHPSGQAHLTKQPIQQQFRERSNSSIMLVTTYSAVYNEKYHRRTKLISNA